MRRIDKNIKQVSTQNKIQFYQNFLPTMNFKFTVFLGIILLFNVKSAHGQQEQAAALTLEECLSYAFENNDSLKNALLDEQIAVAQVGETRAAGLPQITGNASLSKNYLFPPFYS